MSATSLTQLTLCIYFNMLVVDQNVLHKLADHIGFPWKRVGLHLGLHNAALKTNCNKQQLLLGQGVLYA